MFTVMVDLEGSGNRSTCNPLASLYSVMPSTEVTFSMPFGRDCPRRVTAQTHTEPRMGRGFIYLNYKCSHKRGTLGMCLSVVPAAHNSRPMRFFAISAANRSERS